jgi:hypothetical protein
VLIAFDRDEAGDKGAEKVAGQLVEAGLECYRVQFPRGMDANEYARKMEPADKALSLVLRSAVWMGKGPARTAGDLAVAAREAVVVNTHGEVVPPTAVTEPNRARCRRWPLSSGQPPSRNIPF